MKKALLILFTLLSINIFAGGPPPPLCTPATTNGSCATATSLTSGSPCINGTSCGGNGEFGGTCLFAGSECSWYSFVATSANMYVNIVISTTSGCHISSNVFSSGGSCATLGAQISCLSGAPLDDFHTLTGLTIGNTYYVQVCYPLGGPCGNSGKATWCIDVGDIPPPCNTCVAPCGTAQGYAANPTVAQVVADCTTLPFAPPLQPSSTHTFCYSLTAASTSIDFNVIITSNCGGGNVIGFSWSLYNSPACGGPIQTGTLASLTFSPVVIGNTYVFCYTFTVPATCTHSQHCPYFVGAAPLPIVLKSFDGYNEDGVNYLEWITSSEINNDFFTLKRSRSGEFWEVIAVLQGAGNSSVENVYNYSDDNYMDGVTYYSLTQTDFDGKSEIFPIIAINTPDNIDYVKYKIINLLGQEVNTSYSGFRFILYEDGRTLLISPSMKNPKTRK